MGRILIHPIAFFLYFMIIEIATCPLSQNIYVLNSKYVCFVFKTYML